MQIQIRNQMGQVRHIHFVGIGGIGMSGIALVLAKRGFLVSGSDLSLQGEIMHTLQAAGIQIFQGHDAQHVAQADVVVVSSAIPEQNVERVAAQQLAIPILKRAEMLAELMRFQRGIAISGTHGKTTTTSMVSKILEHAQLDPTVVVGGQIKCSKSQMRVGESEYFVAEADESDASFLYLRPVIAVMTSLDFDHMDTYQGCMTHLEEAFVQFAQQLPFYGTVVLCLDDERLTALKARFNRPCLTYGVDAKAQYKIASMQQQGLVSSFSLCDPNGQVHNFILNCPGMHNVRNAVAAIVVAHQCGVDWAVIREGIAQFVGVQRRFDQLGVFALSEQQRHVTVIDDYGHHPKAIEVTLTAAKQAWPERRIVLCFEPHRYSRLSALFDAFVSALQAADVVILLPVYACGEAEIAGANSAALGQALQAAGHTAVSCVEDFSVLAAQLNRTIQATDILLGQGAGRISSALRALVQQWTMETQEVSIE